LSITAKSQTITGNKTTTPNQGFANLSPSSGAVTRPFTISWTVPSATQPASHAWVFVSHNSDNKKSYQVVVPISQTSVQITSDHIDAGSYFVGVYGVNSMSLDGARDGSISYVGSTDTGAATGQAITVN
jgi:hypothetical protein